jgi:tetratricopeptide (TPR) repeat protein
MKTSNPYNTNAFRLLRVFPGLPARLPRLVAAAALSAVTLLAGPPATAEAAGDRADDKVAELLEHAAELIEAGQADSALAAVIPYLGQPPVDSRITQALVTTSSAAGTPWRAMRAVFEMIQVRPGDVQLHIALGQIELERNRPEVALRHFQRALLIDDHAAEALGGLGRARGQQEIDLEPALDYYDDLARAAPNVPSIRYGKAMLLLEAGRLEESRGEFRWAIGLEEKNWLYRRDYARALVELGERASAIEHLTEAVELARKAGDPLTAGKISADLAKLRSGGDG